ncbi:NAC domain containing protein 52-like [Cynara cardunculus var. scolymus]|uniref:NAC domain containing protein 52-like n=1 Tax=Cynara cardunculus var. scolymus TaxID=59895 RepID=UPI000D630A14|nr:NAC domain containing protein 52-like [Cynara cardunculus var. scolymus]XP_024985333.1 NAC domain containing protein 52-like [Cynara cardunculus var. scolymus]
MTSSSLIPGFRFHPTDVELVMYYLKRKLLGKKINTNAVAEVNIYDFCPWDLPDMSSLKSGDLEWFFFCPKARKYLNGSRSNRATETGFWKATGRERPVTYRERTVAMIKTLVFHLGNAPNGKRTDWVMHEYCMKDGHLDNGGIVQDAYVLCKIFQKSGAGPKNGAQYGKPFNEDEYDDDDVAICSEPQAVIGPDGTTNTLNHKQKGPATMTLTEPGSSTVTFSANETTNTSNHKQKGPAIMNTAEPGSSMVTFSANETTNARNHKQKGPATMNTSEPGSSTVTFSANGATNAWNHKQMGPAIMNTTEPGSSIGTFSANETRNARDHKQKGPATMNTTEPGSSTVTFSANGATNAWNHKQKGPATMDMIVPQRTCSLIQPGPSTFMFSANKRCADVPANDDVLFLEDMDLFMRESSTDDDDDGLFSEDVASIMGVSTEDVNGNNKKEGFEKGKSVAANDENGIYDNLDDLCNLDDLAFKTDAAEHTLGTSTLTVDDLRDFYVD